MHWPAPIGFPIKQWSRIRERRVPVRRVPCAQRRRAPSPRFAWISRVALERFSV